MPHESYDVFQNKIIPHITKDNEYPDTLFVRGHHPHKDVLEMLKKPFRFVGCYPTYFPKNIQELDQDNDHNHKSCMYDIIKNTENMVNQYTYIDRYRNLHDFSTYHDFYNFYNNQRYDDDEGHNNEESDDSYDDYDDESDESGESDDEGQ